MGSTTLLSDAQVRAALEPTSLAPAMDALFRQLARGEAENLPRSAIRQENGNILAVMTAALPRQGVWGCKTAVFPGPGAVDTAQSTIQVFDVDSGALRGIVAAGYITLARTAACSAVATAALAVPDTSVLCLLGGGEQAVAHAVELCRVRPIREIRVWRRDKAACQAVCRRISQLTGVTAAPAQGAQQADAGAHIVCTVTTSRTPVLQGEWLSPGTHVNAVGACGPMARELDLSVLRRSRVYVDSLLSMPQATGDLLIPIREGSYRMEDIAGELGGVLTGSCPGRAGGDRETITLFESCGLAMEDIGAALAALQAAEGTPFPF